MVGELRSIYLRQMIDGSLKSSVLTYKAGLCTVLFIYEEIEISLRVAQAESKEQLV